MPGARTILLLGLIALTALCGSGLGSIAIAVPIGDLHENDSNGVPAPPYTTGTPVEVTGVVTVPDTVFHQFSTAVHVQDVTGGIYIFQSGVGAWDLELGDSVTVSGSVEHFLGLTEITGLTDVTIHQRGQPVPSPTPLTCAEVNETFDPGTFREEHESRLIRIDDVTITSGAWPTSPGGSTSLSISDVTGSTTLFINQNPATASCPASGAT
jgi:hypothetical protein